MERDPVCGMRFNNIIDTYRSAYKGGMIYFCCSNCKEMFDNNPETYISGMHYELNISKTKPDDCKCENINLIMHDYRR